MLANIILRIPILYGLVESLEESAITILFKFLKEKNTIVSVSDYEIRRPSHVDDIAAIILGLIRTSKKNVIKTYKIFKNIYKYIHEYFFKIFNI